MRRLIALLLLAGCGGRVDEAPPTLLERGRAYVDDLEVGRRALEASLVNPANTYSRHRLARYRADAWGANVEFRPRVRFVGEEWADDTWDATFDEPSLLALGERAFFAYPVQLRPELAKDDVEAYGVEPRSFVEVEVPSGVTRAVTCATCHASGGRAGVPNHRLELGRLMDDWARAHSELSAWGPGAIDVTSDGLENPTAIPDLRPIAYQTHLHRAATVVNDPIALAVRTETLIITSLSEALRPPRIVAFALALYMWRMVEALPTWAPNATFEAECAGCHGADGRPAAPRDLEEIGTPDLVARSPDRTTGKWRVPSLMGVGQRERLLSMGRVAGLEALLDPARATPGHTFGWELSASERAELIDFLRAR